MPRNDDDIEQGSSPITPPEEDIEEQELSEPVSIPMPAPVPEPEPAPVQPSKWDWIGSPSRPEAKEHSDGISDLFTVTDEDVDAGEGVEDLVTVDMEKDILDADDDGSLNDLVDVTEEDIMGSEDYGQRPSKPASRQARTRYRITPRYQPPPTSMGRSG